MHAVLFVCWKGKNKDTKIEQEWERADARYKRNERERAREEARYKKMLWKGREQKWSKAKRFQRTLVLSVFLCSKIILLNVID